MRKIIKVKYILITTLVFLFSFKHPFYLGVTELKYDTKTKSMQCAVKLFTNDLEDALKKINGKSVDLINVKDTASTTKILNSYLASHLALKINDKPITFKFIGFEREEEAIWMYLEHEKCEVPRKIEVRNTLLYDYLSGQTNIVHTEVGEFKKSLKASNPESDFVFLF